MYNQKFVLIIITHPILFIGFVTINSHAHLLQYYKYNSIPIPLLKPHSQPPNFPAGSARSPLSLNSQ